LRGGGPIGSFDFAAWQDDPVSQQSARYQRTFSGLVGAMVVLLLVVLAFVLFRALNRSDVEDPVQPVDYADNLEFWQSEASFELLAPAALPDGWIATSARFESSKPQSWHLGVLTDDDHYIGIEQERADEASMVGEFVDEHAVAGDEVSVTGATWHAYSDEGGDHALVRRADGVTTLVVGTVSQDRLIAFVETLR
jgi:hypothetical protein